MTASAGLALACRRMTAGYGATPVVHEIDLDVGRGEMVALLGPSGSGKTTILAALAGFIRIRSGEILIGGRSVASAKRHEPPERRDVAVVFQGYALWPHMTARQTVAFPLRRRGMPAAEAGDEAGRILDRLGIGPLAGRRPSELSGGEQQRVGLGRALARSAGLYLFDEPTAHLDAFLRDRLEEEISEQRRRSGAAAIYATHDTAEALAIADRVVLLRDGRIVQQGSPNDVYERPADPWAARLTGPASVLRAALRTRKTAAPASTWMDAGSVLRSHRPDRGLQANAAVMRPDRAHLGGELQGRVDDVAYRGNTRTTGSILPPGPSRFASPVRRSSPGGRARGGRSTGCGCSATTRSVHIPSRNSRGGVWPYAGDR